MAEEKKVQVNDETGYINSEELNEVLKETEEPKKEGFFKKLFKKKNKENK